MQLKTVGESLTAFNTIQTILNDTSLIGEAQNRELVTSLKKYSDEALKTAISQSALTTEQVKAILSSKGLTGELLETTAAELTQATATTTLSAAEATAATSTGGLTLALKGLGAQLKALIVAHPVIAAIAAIGVTTFAVVKAVDYFNKSLERQKEKLSKAKTQYEETKSELENINSELETTRKRIEELNNIEHPSLIDQEEIERAIAYAEALELAADAAERRTQLEKENYSKQNEKTFQKEYGEYLETNHEQRQKDLLDSARNSDNNGYTLHTIAVEKPTDIDAQIAAIEYFTERLQEDTKLYNEALANEDQVLADEYKMRADAWEREIEAFKNNLNNSQDTLNAYSQNAIAAGDIDSEYYRQIQELEKSIYSYLSPAKWNTIKFDSIFNKKDIEATKNELVSLAKEGKLDANTIKGYTNLNKAIEETDFILEDGVDVVEMFVEQIYSAIEAGSEFSDVGEEISNKFNLSEDQFKAFDTFKSQINSIQEALDNLSTSTPEENFERLLNLMEEDPGFDLTMYRSADGTIDYERALTQLKQNALDKVIATIPQLTEELQAYADSVENAFGKANRLIDDYYEVIDVLDKMKRGIALTAVEAAELINKHSELAGAVQVTTEGIYFEKDALIDLAGQCSTTANQSIAAAITQTKGVIEEIKKRIKAYEIERQAQEILLNSSTQSDIDSGLVSQRKDDLIRTSEAQKALYLRQKEEESHLGNLIDSLDEIQNTNNQYGIGKSGGSSKSTAEEFSDNIDLISESIATLTEKVSFLETKLASAKSYEEQIQIATELTQAEDNLSEAYQKAADKYKEQYLALKNGLPKDYINALESGDVFKIKELKGTGGEKISKQFDEALEAYRNWQEMEKNYQESLNKWSEDLNWAAENVTTLTSKLSMLEAKLDNSESYKNNIKYCDMLIKTHKELRDSYEDLLGVYRGEYQSSIKGLDSSYIKAIKSGSMSEIEKFKGVVDEQTYNQILEALEAYRKIQEAEANLHKEHEAWQNSFLDKADVISNWYGYRIDNIDTRSNAIQNEISMQESSGLAVPVKYYEEQRKLEENKLDYLKRQRDDLIKIRDDALSSGAIAEYSPEWYTLTAQIQDANLAIQDCQKSMINLDNSIRDIKWDNFDRLMEKLETINEEAAFLIDLMSRADMIDSDGKFTEEGLATAAMHRTKYQTYQDQAQKYKTEADSLAGATDETSVKRREELLELYRECISAAQDEKQAMVELAQEGIQKQIDNMSELISKKKEALQAERDLQNYRESIAEKQKKITDIEKAMAALAGDDSEEAKKKMRQLRSDLTDAKKDLEETERDHAYEEEEKALDNLLEAYTTNMEEVMKDTEKLFTDTMEVVDNASETVGNTIQKVATEAGYEITSHITNIWKDSATEANKSADTFESVGERITGVITGIASEWAKVQEAAEKAGEAQLKAMDSEHMSSGTNDTTMKATIENLLKDSKNYSSKLVTSKSDANYAGLSSLNKALVDNGYGNLSYQGMAELANLLKINGVQNHTAVSVSKDPTIKKLLEQSLRDYGIFGGTTSTTPSSSPTTTSNSSSKTSTNTSSNSKTSSDSNNTKTTPNSSDNYVTVTKTFTDDRLAPLSSLAKTETKPLGSFFDAQLDAFLKNSANYSSKRITSPSDEGYSKLSSLNQKLINGGYGNLSYQGMAGLANLLGIGGRKNYTKTDAENDSNLKKLIEEELKRRNVPGFSTGGIIKSVTGEDGFLLAQKGEAILSKEAVRALQNINLSSDMYQHILDLPFQQEAIARNIGGQTTISGNPVQIHVDHVENMDDFIHKMQDERTQKLLQEAIWSPVMGRGNMGIYKV